MKAKPATDPRHTPWAKQRFAEAVGEAIRAAREANGVTMTELARRTGLNGSTLQNTEAGLTCSAYVLAHIAEALDVTLDELVPVDATGAG